MAIDIELIKNETDKNIRFKSVPCVVFRSNGASYFNKKAASILNLNHGDLVMFYNTSDMINWYVSNDDNNGSMISKKRGLFQFSNMNVTKKIFAAYGIKGKKAFFKMATQLEEINGIKTLYIIPQPFNLD